MLRCNQATFSRPTGAEISSFGGVIRCFAVIDGFVSTSQANRVGMFFLHILSHKADLDPIIAFVIIAIDRLTIVGFADFLDVFFKPLVRHCGVGRVAGKRPGSFSDIRQELGRLERISLLLKKLIIEGCEARLLRLLCCLTSG